MKSRIRAILIAIGAVVLVGSITAKPLRRLYNSAWHTMQTETFLVINNGDLYRMTQPFGQQVIWDLVAPTQTKDFSAKVAKTSTGFELRIVDHGKVVTRPGPVQGIRYVDAAHILYFESMVQTTAALSGRNSRAAYQLWSWNRKTGFKAISDLVDYLGEPMVSLDGTTLFVPGSDKIGMPTMIKVDAKTNVASPFQIPKSAPSQPDAFLDADTLLFRKVDQPDIDRVPNPDAKRELWIYHLSSGKSERVQPNHNLERAVVFEGSIYALEKVNDQETVVRLSPKLDAIEQSVSLPKR